jgi:hypothetical protein
VVDEEWDDEEEEDLTGVPPSSLYYPAPDGHTDGDIDDDMQMAMVNDFHVDESESGGWGAEPAENDSVYENVTELPEMKVENDAQLAELKANMQAAHEAQITQIVAEQNIQRQAEQAELVQLRAERVEITKLKEEQVQQAAVMHSTLGSASKAAFPCDDCEEGAEDESVMHCEECGLNLCDAHTDAHKRAKRSKLHVLNPHRHKSNAGTFNQDLDGEGDVNKVAFAAMGGGDNEEDDFDVEGDIEAMFNAGTDLGLQDAMDRGMDLATFKAIDADGNGTLSMDEFRNWQQQKAGGTN